MDSVKQGVAGSLPTPALPHLDGETDDLPTAILRKHPFPTRSEPADPDWPRIRGYELLSIIGRGGMGIVYEARQRNLNRTVALKTLRGSILDDQLSRDRFHAEAEAVARLQHPNIIQVFEVGRVDCQGTDAGKNPFIALEFVDGGNLSQRTQKPQPPREAAEMVEKLARAVHAAHELGVIHRDLKPANVLLTRAGEPKIADFGLAKQLESEQDSSGRFLTLAGTVLGTPEYMAPEQINGDPATPAIDTYALGVLFYELLTARLPFQAATPTETFDLVRTQEPVPPRRLQPTLPRDLDTICVKCLEKDPARRYDSALALGEDLRRFLDHTPIRARRSSTLEKVARWCRRNPLVTCSLAGVVCTFLSAFVLVTMSYWRSERAREEVAQQRDEAREREKAERWERYRANIVASSNALQMSNVGNARRTLEAAPEEYRHWEWYHFHSKLDQAQDILGSPSSTLHHDAVLVARGRRAFLRNAPHLVHIWDTVERRLLGAFRTSNQLFPSQVSPDGRYRVQLNYSNQAVLVESDTNRTLARLLAHDAHVFNCGFSPDSSYLATASLDGLVCRWEVPSGKLQTRHKLSQTNIGTLAIHRDGLRISVQSKGDPDVHVWNIETGKHLLVLRGHKVGLQEATTNLRGDQLITTENYPHAMVRIWEASTGRLLATLQGHTNTITSVALDPTDKRIATTSRDQTIRLWDSASGRQIALLRGHLGWVQDSVFSPDGTRLVTGARDGTVRLWNAKTGEAVALLYGHTAEVRSVRYTEDGRTILSASLDGTVRYWDALAVEQNNTLRGHTTFVYSVAFHPNGEHVASASWDGTARLWHASSGKQLALLKHPDKAFVTSVAFHPSGEFLASRDRDAVRLWDVATGKEIHCWKVSNDGWQDTRLAFDSSGKLLASGCVGKLVRIWDVASRREVANLGSHEEGVRDLAFSPDGRWLATTCEGPSSPVRIWDVATWKLAQILTGHPRGSYTLAFNQSGTLLASAGCEGKVLLRDTTTWQVVATLAHGSYVHGLAFDPSGKRLACGCADNSIRLWDVQTQQEVAELRGHSSYVHQVAFSPDSTRLVSGSGDGTVHIWDTLSAQRRQARKR